jgi:adenylate kinase
MRSILVTGVQGVGKSTISRLAAHTLCVEGWDYAELMLRVAPNLRGKDDIQRLPWDERNRIYRRVDNFLEETFMPGDGRRDCVLLENHLSIIDEGGIRTFPHEAIRRYNPIGLVLVEASPREVTARRTADRDRARHVGTAAEVAAQQATNCREAELIARRIRIPMISIGNGDHESAAKALAAWARRVMS